MHIQNPEHSVGKHLFTKQKTKQKIKANQERKEQNNKAKQKNQIK